MFLSEEKVEDRINHFLLCRGEGCPEQKSTFCIRYLLKAQSESHKYFSTAPVERNEHGRCTCEFYTPALPSRS